MKIRFGILILFLVAPITTAYGHSEFFFPRLFTPAELPNTGFALLNPDNFTATVTLYLVSAAGAQVSPLVTLRIGPGGQLSRKGSELFPNATTSGWVYVVTDGEGMQAFWVIYDAGITFLDGAEAVQVDTFGPDQIIPFVAGQTELSVINPNGIDVPVTIRLFGNDGELAPAFSRQIVRAGGYQADVSSIFPSADMTQARYIRIRTTQAPIASLVQIRGFLVPTESAIINGTNVAPALTRRGICHSCDFMCKASRRGTRGPGNSFTLPSIPPQSRSDRGSATVVRHWKALVRLRARGAYRLPAGGRSQPR